MYNITISVVQGENLNKLPLEIQNDNQLTQYLVSKEIEGNQDMVDLLRRYGITETINPIKKLFAKSLNENWKHVYLDSITADIVYDNYMNSKGFNRTAFKELDEFERLFTHQLMNTYLENYSDILSIINHQILDQIADDTISEFIKSFIKEIADIQNVQTNTNHIYSFFNNSINKNDSSLNKKIRLFKILKYRYQKEILENVNKYGNFKFSTSEEDMKKCMELNAINKMRNIVCHNNSVQYACYEMVLKVIYIRFKKYLDETDNIQMKEMQKQIKNIKYRKSLIFYSLKVLNRKNLNNKATALGFEQIYNNTISIYNRLIYTEFNQTEDLNQLKEDFINKMNAKRPNYFESQH